MLEFDSLSHYRLGQFQDYVPGSAHAQVDATSRERQPWKLLRWILPILELPQVLRRSYRPSATFAAVQVAQII